MSQIASLFTRVREVLQQAGFSLQFLAGEQEGSTAVTLIVRDSDTTGATASSGGTASAATPWWQRPVPRALPESVLAAGSRLTGGCSLSLAVRGLRLHLRGESKPLPFVVVRSALTLGTGAL